MITWLKKLLYEEYEVTIWFVKEVGKTKDGVSRKVKSKKVFSLKKISTKKPNHFKGIDTAGNPIEIRTSEPFDYQIKKIY